MKPVYILNLHSWLLISCLNVAGSVYTVAGLNKLRPRLKNVKLATSAAQQETLTTCFLCQVGAGNLSETVVLRDVLLRDVVLRDVVLRDVVLRDVVLMDVVLRDLKMSGGRLTVAGTIFVSASHFIRIWIQHYRLNADPDQTKN
jgi:hypothetical protein